MFEVNYIRAQVLGANSNTLPLADAQGNAQSGTCLTLEGGVVCDVTSSFCSGAQRSFGETVKAFWVVVSLAFPSHCSIQPEWPCCVFVARCPQPTGAQPQDNVLPAPQDCWSHRVTEVSAAIRGR